MNNTFQIIQTSQSEYMYSNVTPQIPEIDLENLKHIVDKLRAYSNGAKNNGLNRKELEQFLDWVTFNARSYAVRNIPLSITEAIVSEPMTGQCAPTQNINVKLLKKIGLDVHPFNLGECIESAQIPMSPEDKRRIQNGWSSTAVRHSVAIVKIPILTQHDYVQEYEFLLDPTFRQFCLLENNDISLFKDTKRLLRGYVAPHPAFFMEQNLCQELIRKGYVWLNPERAKQYGDAFKYASVREEYQRYIQNTTGEQYLYFFRNIPMEVVGNKKDEEKYTQLPSEIENAKKMGNGFWKRLINIIFRNRGTEQNLPVANTTPKDTNIRMELRVDSSPTNKTKYPNKTMRKGTPEIQL